MSDDRTDQQIERLREAFDAPDAHTLAIKLGIEFAQLRRWQDGAPIPWTMFLRASERTGQLPEWLACREGAQRRPG